MALRACEECGKEFSDTVKVCPSCGFVHADAGGWSWWKVLLTIVFVPLAILFVIGLFIADPAPDDSAGARVSQERDRMAAECAKGYQSSCDRERLLADMLRSQGY